MQTVLITGCSTGIGYETALHLARNGWRVFATMRDLKKAGPLRTAARGLPLELLQLDVTKAASVRRAVATVLLRAGRIDALVNNAGYGVFGASDEFTDAECRSQFDVNLYGLHRVTRECLPVMRRQAQGRVVLVGSLAGRVAFAGIGLYCASKFAVEAYAESLRLEGEPFGVQAAVVEPGQIRTPFKVNQVKSKLLVSGSSAHQGGMEAAYEASRFRASDAPGPAAVARVIGGALAAPNMKVRYPVGPDAVWIPRVRWVLPESAWGALMRGVYWTYRRKANDSGRRLTVSGRPGTYTNLKLTAESRQPTACSVALVSGSTSGIGLACVKLLASRGWRVYAGYRDARKLPILRSETAGLDVRPIRLDVDQAASVDRAVSTLIHKEGKIDALVNNAGFALAGCWEDLSDGDLSAQMETNVFGCLRLVRAVAPVLRAQGSGRIVNIASVAAFTAAPGLGAYSASKHALSALTEAWRLELAPFGVQVTEVDPGEFKTHIVSATRRGRGVSPNSAYGNFYRNFETYVGREFGKAPAPVGVARVVAKALESSRMARRYLVKPGDRALWFLKWLLQDSLWLWILGKAIPVPPGPEPPRKPEG